MGKRLAVFLNSFLLLQLKMEPLQTVQINNNVVCATSKGSDQPAHTHSLIIDFASRSNTLWVFKLLTEYQLEFLSLKGGCIGPFPFYSCKNDT